MSNAREIALAYVTAVGNGDEGVEVRRSNDSVLFQIVAAHNAVGIAVTTGAVRSQITQSAIANNDASTLPYAKAMRCVSIARTSAPTRAKAQ